MPETKIVLAHSILSDHEWWKHAGSIVSRVMPRIAVEQFGLSPDAFLVVCQRMLVANPALWKCTKLSWANALIQAARLGLMPGGMEGQAWLIPYENECTLQIGYLGFVALAARAGVEIQARMVYQRDKADIALGSNGHVSITPAEVFGKERGKPKFAVAWAMRQGRIIGIAVHSREDAEKRRKCSPASRAGRPRGTRTTRRCG